MKYRSLLIGSVICLPIGVILGFIIGPVIASAGVSSHFEGWWIFGSTVTDITATYWVGVGIAIVGIIFLIAGVFGILMAFLLEALDRQHKPQQNPPPP
jgi:hypothetical protein